MAVLDTHNPKVHKHFPGKVERWNQTLGEKLEKMMSEHKTKRWIDFAADIVGSYRAMESPQDGISPFEIFYRRKPNHLLHH